MSRGGSIARGAQIDEAFVHRPPEVVSSLRLEGMVVNCHFKCNVGIFAVNVIVRTNSGFWQDYYNALVNLVDIRSSNTVETLTVLCMLHESCTKDLNASARLSFEEERRENTRKKDFISKLFGVSSLTKKIDCASVTIACFIMLN